MNTQYIDIKIQPPHSLPETVLDEVKEEIKALLDKRGVTFVAVETMSLDK